jgi:mRNA interferase RelE/StbE
MEVLLHRAADKYLARLPESFRSNIEDALEGLGKEPPEGNVRPYEGNPGVWRLKVGRYRALYKIEGGAILVTHIVPRGQAYTKKTRNSRRKK